jgi:prepilin-type N-terminal cleavage/methylation domain-containing protein
MKTLFKSSSFNFLFRWLILNHQQGFTLLELLVSLVLISILLSIAVPSYFSIVKRSFPECKERSCAGLDPKEQRCDKSVRTLSISDLGGSLLELRYSVFCKASWARAKAPAGSMIYVQDGQGRTYGSWVIPRSLQHVANFSDMGPGELKACIRYSTGNTVCTD